MLILVQTTCVQSKWKEGHWAIGHAKNQNNTQNTNKLQTLHWILNLMGADKDRDCRTIVKNKINRKHIMLICNIRCSLCVRGYVSEITKVTQYYTSMLPSETSQHTLKCQTTIWVWHLEALTNTTTSKQFKTIMYDDINGGMLHITKSGKTTENWSWVSFSHSINYVKVRVRKKLTCHSHIDN